MHPVIRATFLLVIGLHTLDLTLFAQTQVRVVSKPFDVIATDSNFRNLDTKVPFFLCNGLLYRSSLKLESIYAKKDIAVKNSILNKPTSILDTAKAKIYRHWLDTLHADYLLEGEIGINDNQFYINFSANDFVNPSIVYSSEFRPISEFQRAMDVASENLNYQIQLLRGGNTLKRVLVSNFMDFFDKGVYGKTSDNIYAPDFLTRYLSYNLKNSRNFIVLPYELSQTSLETDSNSVNSKKYIDFYISGKVTFLKGGNCLIQPIIVDNDLDTVSIGEIRNHVDNRTFLLSETLDKIQSFLEINIDSATVKLNKIKIRSSLVKDYDSLFNNSLKENNLQLAIFYSDSLSNNSDLLKGKLYYRKNDFSEARKHLESYLQSNPSSNEANYYLGLSYLKQGRYAKAKSYLSNVDTASAEYIDIYYQRGICYYSLNITDTALEQFLKQKSIGDTVHKDVYLYLGAIYFLSNDLKNAEDNYSKLLSLDSTNQVYRKYVGEFYSKMASKYRLIGDFDKAFNYSIKSYDIHKSYWVLLNAAESAARLSWDNRLDEIINEGIRDSVFNPAQIYMALADFSKEQRDSSSHYIPECVHVAITLLLQHIRVNQDSSAVLYQSLGVSYFTLDRFDSAEYYYKLALSADRNEPLNYFNLAELQVLLLKPDSALATLNRARNRFRFIREDLKNVRFATNGSLSQALYLFYSEACKIIKKIPYSTEKKALQDIYDKLGMNNEFIFLGWSFNTFYFWLTGTEALDKDVKRALVKNLCLAMKHSVVGSLDCPLE